MSTCLIISDRPSRGVDHTLDRSLQWSREADRITGSRRPGSQTDQLNQPCGLFVHDTSTIYVADSNNHRIVAWSLDQRQASVIAGLRGRGEDVDQLDMPMDVIVNQRTKRLIICDTRNRRIVSCALEGDDEEFKSLISDVSCEGLTMDEQGFLYFSDSEKHEVRRVKLDNLKRTVLVAGGHGRGTNMDQLWYPTYLFVDREGALYITDSRNHRVMRWSAGAKEGEIVAGGNGEGDELDQLCYPNGIVVDNRETIHVADTRNNRIMAWSRDAREGVVSLSSPLSTNKLPSSSSFTLHMIVTSSDPSTIFCHPPTFRETTTCLLLSYRTTQRRLDRILFALRD